MNARAISKRYCAANNRIVTKIIFYNVSNIQHYQYEAQTGVLRIIVIVAAIAFITA